MKLKPLHDRVLVKRIEEEEQMRGGISGSGLGLMGMRERVELSGGMFQLQSAAGMGTTIRAAWPCS